MMRRLPTLPFVAVVSLLAAASLSGHAEPEADAGLTPEAWLVRTSRIEGAAGNVREWAASVQEVTGRILEQGRLVSMAELVSRTEELNRRVVGATLAAEVLDQPL